MDSGSEGSLAELAALLRTAEADPARWRAFVESGRAAEAWALVEETRENASELRKRLAAEEERLIKLWDVYKFQEQELASVRMDREQKSRLAADLAAAEAQIRDMDERLRNAGNAAKAWEEMELVRARAEAAERERDADRQRLAKLYAAYEELEAEKDRLSRELKERAAWLAENKAALDELVRSLRRSGPAESASGSPAPKSP
ncbi:MAG: hypothetical protein ACYDDF_12100 [Thermoplasmatota archaeon]